MACCTPRWIKWARLRRSPNPVNEEPVEEESVEDVFRRAVDFDVCASGTVDKEKAAALYRRAVEKGHVTAMYALANLLIDGTFGVPRDAKAAVELYERAINEGGDTDAMFRLGRLLWEGSNGVEKDSERGLNLLTRSAELGNGSAMTVVGVLKMDGGDGVVKDTEEAVELLTRAVEECEDPIAMEKLAYIYRDGADGIEVDAKRAVELYEWSIKKSGNTEAMRGLGVLYCKGGKGVVKDVGRGAEMFERAIREGENTMAMVNLGDLLSSDVEGTPRDVPRDVPRAVELYKRAVYLGDEEDAIVNLARWLFEGHEGVEQDTDEALRILRRAVSEKSSFKAMALLGRVLAFGLFGVEQDPEALDLVMRAMNEGQNALAMRVLGLLTCDGDLGLVADGKRGIELLEEAASRGEHGALMTLGNIFDKGAAGVVRDEEKAIEVFTRAIEEYNDYKSRYNLSLLLWEKENRTEEDQKRMWELLEQGVKEGRSACMNMVSTMLMSGEYGKPKNLKRAKRLLYGAMKIETNSCVPYNLGVLYYDDLPRTPHNVQRAAHFFDMAVKQVTLEDGPYRNAYWYLAKILWRGEYGIRPNHSRAIRLLKRAIEAENKLSDVKLMAKWVLSGRGGTEGDLDYVRKLLRKTIARCPDPRKQSDLRRLLEKCNRTTMIALQNGQVRLSAGKGIITVS